MLRVSNIREEGMTRARKLAVLPYLLTKLKLNLTNTAK